MRLKEEALCVKINSKHISEITIKSIDDAKKWFDELPKFLNDKEIKLHNMCLKKLMKD